MPEKDQEVKTYVTTLSNGSQGRTGDKGDSRAAAMLINRPPPTCVSDESGGFYELERNVL